MDDTNDKREGQVDELKGRVQEAYGDLTGNEEKQAEGQANQTKGKTEQVVGDIKQAVNDATG